MTNTPTWPTFPVADETIREIARQDAQDVLDAINTPPVADPNASLPLDPAADRKEYADLQALLASITDDDGTEIEMLTADEFASETFTPPSPPSPQE
jgi:hypothetical protein